ncbi:MAG TPA: hypothetical protein VLH60_06670, partial [Sedimentisphaerales bacterium]|nr:hypothetical protein [Sedimentisphaerales bacterium]
TRAGQIVPAIMLFMLAVGWLPLLLRRYTRRAPVFSLIVMTASFAVSCMVASALIIRPVWLLRLPAVVILAWLVGGLWGWIIVYLDRQKWRMGEKLAAILHGTVPLEDVKSRRPFLTVVAVSALALAVFAGIWIVGREKLWGELWRESGYRKRLWVAQHFVEYGWLIGNQQNQVVTVFGTPEWTTDNADAGMRTFWWPIGVAPPGATSYMAEQRAFLIVTMSNDRVTEAVIRYHPPGFEPGSEPERP